MNQLLIQQKQQVRFIKEQEIESFLKAIMNPYYGQVFQTKNSIYYDSPIPSIQKLCVEGSAIEEFLFEELSMQIFNDPMQYIALYGHKLEAEYKQAVKDNYGDFMWDVYETYRFHHVCFRPTESTSLIINNPMNEVW